MREEADDQEGRTPMDSGMDRRIRMHNSDCLVGMSRIETGSVDLVLCDLPYGTTKCPWDRVLPLAHCGSSIGGCSNRGEPWCSLRPSPLPQS
ncbi:MAG: hypothetical protein ACLT09_07010 [Flavonifractor plautii]